MYVRGSRVPRTAMTTTLLVVAILPLHLGRFKSFFFFLVLLITGNRLASVAPSTTKSKSHATS